MNDFFTYEFNVSVISLATFVPPGSGDTVHRNRKFHGIVYNCDGIKKYVFKDGNSLLIKENEIIYLPKYSNYTVESLESGGCYAINFDITENRTFDHFSYKPKNQQALVELFQNAEVMWRLKKTGYTLKCRADLYNILFLLQNDFHIAYVRKDKANLIRPAMEYIRENYTRGVISIPHIASLCNISEAYFRSIFHKIHGITPVRYIGDLKIARAKELILSGYYSIHETAVLSGFGDYSYFSREFKKRTGFSPLEFKRMNQ